MSEAKDAWDPAQYQRFRAERERPFFDLLELVDARPGMRVLDLGCGTGALTAEAHRRLVASRTLGVDRSAAMLAGAPAAEGLSFTQGRIEDIAAAPEHASAFDLVLANASLQWVDDHAALLPRLFSLLAPSGQLAVQMPANFSHPSHTIAAKLAQDPEFAAALGRERAVPVLSPERYAELLFSLGAKRQRVRLEVYAHALPSRDDVIEWVKGTLLTWHQERLPPEAFTRFIARYRAELLAALPDDRPYLYTYPRVFLWAER
ncbi:MAG: trans-aconitate methyltransferase [Deltaproteobacteria bacterium RBG_16_71_12]|nr:MAG: trans-aconitate methyltransferase [Deltaproteobacteria bacterium RBG_16_71_12]